LIKLANEQIFKNINNMTSRWGLRHGISQKSFVIFWNSVLIPYICSLQSHRLWSHAVDVTPPQATTKIMTGRNGRMVEW